MTLLAEGLMNREDPLGARQQPAWLVTVAASAGGIPALQAFIGALPGDLPAAVVILQHRAPDPKESYLNKILKRAGTMPVVNAVDTQAIETGKVYVARSDLHLTISRDRRFLYRDGTRIKRLLSSANPLFESAAVAFKDHVVAVVLTGHGSDATDGVQTVKAHGGIVIAQEPASAEAKSMPQAAIRSGAVDFVLPLDAIAATVDAIVRGRPTPVLTSTN